jgi:hypothetical protein
MPKTESTQILLCGINQTKRKKKKKVEINPYILEQSPNPKDPTQHPFYFCAPQFKNTGGDHKFIPKKKKRITAQTAKLHLR